MANFTTSTPTTSDPSEIHGLLAVGTDNTGKLLDPDALVSNLAYTASPTQGTITSDTGTDATIPAADGTNAGLFLPAEKTKLAGIAAGAEVNVNADWNAVSGDAQILNKPTLGTAAATNSTDYATAAQGTKADSAVQPAALASYQPLATVLTNTTAAFTTAQETKLAGIAAGAEVNVNPDWNAVSGDAQILNKPTLGTAAATNSTDYATAAQGAKADSAVQPAALANYQPLAAVLTNTTAAFTTAQETKLAGIAAGAEVNVNADWNASSGDAQILNKPTLGTAAATNSTDYATAAQGAKADSAVQPAALANYQPIATVLTNTTAAFTTAQETKLAGIAAGAEVNVNPDWNAVSGDAQILNKPTLGTAAATNSTDYATAAQGAKADTAVQPNLLSNLIISTTPPTTRDGGEALVDGDRWFKPTDNGVAGTAGYWVYKIVQANPLVAYWVSATNYYLSSNGQINATTSPTSVNLLPQGFDLLLEELALGTRDPMTTDQSNYWVVQGQWDISGTADIPGVVITINQTQTNISYIEYSVSVAVRLRVVTGGTRYLISPRFTKVGTPTVLAYAYSYRYRQIHP